MIPQGKNAYNRLFIVLATKPYGIEYEYRVPSSRTFFLQRSCDDRVSKAFLRESILAEGRNSRVERIPTEEGADVEIRERWKAWRSKKSSTPRYASSPQRYFNFTPLPSDNVSNSICQSSRFLTVIFQDEATIERPSSSKFRIIIEVITSFISSVANQRILQRADRSLLDNLDRIFIQKLRSSCIVPPGTKNLTGISRFFVFSERKLGC